MKNENVKPRVAIVGLGLLGSALAERLMGQGFDVAGFDIDASRRQVLTQMGGAVVENAIQLSARDCLLLSLPDSNVSADVVREIAPHCTRGLVILDTTTGQPGQMMQIAQQAAACGVVYVDMTVVGSSEQAKRGEIALLVGCANDERDGVGPLVDRIAPIADAISQRHWFLGERGRAAQMKLVVNLVLGLNRAVLGEALALAEGVGLDAADTLDVLRNTAAYSRVMDTKGDKMVRRDYAPQARVRQHHKDVTLIQQMAAENRASTPLTDLQQRLLTGLIDRGFGDCDNSAVIEAFRPDALQANAPSTS